MLLNQAQQAVVDFEEGALLVTACPGSGKTRALVERIKALVDKGVDPLNILAVTFTNKAADEMKERLAKSGHNRNIHISTFHSLCVTILRRCAHLLGWKRNFSICDDSGQSSLMRRLIRQNGLDPKEHDPKKFISKLERKKNTLTSDNDFYTRECDAIEGKIFKEYQESLKLNNTFDFSDLLEQVNRLFIQVPKVQQAYAERFMYILVDEMQDTNLAQLDLVLRLASVHGNIMVVGDSDQCIYTWRAARPENILGFDKHFPKVRVINLEENYRSTPEIIEVANKLIVHNRNRQDVTIVSTRDSGEPVRYLEFDTMEDEAEQVADMIDGMRLDGIGYGDVAVLCRTNSLTRAFEESFRRHEIPYVLIGAFGFYDRKEVRAALAYMKFLANPEDMLSFEELAEMPSRGLGAGSIAKIAKHAIDKQMPFMDALKDSSNGKIKGVQKKAGEAVNKLLDCFASFDERHPYDSLLNIYEDTGLLGFLRGTDEAKHEHRVDNVLELLRGFRAYCARRNNPSLAQYLQEISLMSSSDEADKEESVKLMTVHAAKGLEFPVVFVPGLEEEVFPHKRTLADGSLEEERRVAFVAVTRAMDRLYLCRSKEAYSSNGPSGTVPSRFLVEMGFVDPNAI